MSFKKCINDGVSEGLIKQDQADEVFELFDDLETQYNKQMGSAAASAKASMDATAAIKKLKADKKRQALLHAQTWKKITTDFSTYKNGNDITTTSNLTCQSITTNNQNINVASGTITANTFSGSLSGTATRASLTASGHTIVDTTNTCLLYTSPSPRD